MQIKYVLLIRNRNYLPSFLVEFSKHRTKNINIELLISITSGLYILLEKFISETKKETSVSQKPMNMDPQGII